jgi:YidC/Oxa1 family membrane protein insertase
MKFDRNTIVGFLILAALFIGYFYYTSKGQEEAQRLAKIERAKQDSIIRANIPKTDSLTQKVDSATAEANKKIAAAGNFQTAANGKEELLAVENELMRITFSNKGGQIKMVELKKHKNQDSNWVKLAGTEFDKFSYTINTGTPAKPSVGQTGELFFNQGTTTKNADGSTTVSFLLSSADTTSSSTITHTYTIKKDDYMIDFTAGLKGANTLLTQGNMNVTWQYTVAQQESDITFERTNTQMGYVEDGEFDYNTIGRRSNVPFNKSTDWIGLRQRFFFGAIVSKNPAFASGKMEWTEPDKKGIIAEVTSNMKVQLPVASDATAHFSIYYGPSDYQTLKKYDQNFEKLINLGQGPYAFVRPLNKFVVMPIFNFMQGFVNNYGLAIALLTLFIRLLISPLTYSSYLSGAKMKALRPEIAKLKEKHGTDQQAMSMEQMKLFREAGVNPLGGCIPALLQIPIFFALYSFFNSEIGLRGSNFLWAKDLSAFDDVIKFGVDIPLLGSHLSLFTITAVITSFLISLYSMSMTPDQSNPIMKWLPYIFPVFLLFIFNSMPSALTWYYTVSNIITLALQFVIQNYIIDHDKILAKIEANRKKPKTKSKWQERMEQMQEQQKKMKEMQQKNKR